MSSRIGACVRPLPTTSDIMQFVEDRVAPHKRIREVEFVWEIPKTATGEILRRELMQRERARSEGAIE